MKNSFIDFYFPVTDKMKNNSNRLILCEYKKIIKRGKKYITKILIFSFSLLMVAFFVYINGVIYDLQHENFKKMIFELIMIIFIALNARPFFIILKLYRKKYLFNL